MPLPLILAHWLQGLDEHETWRGPKSKRRLADEPLLPASELRPSADPQSVLLSPALAEKFQNGQRFWDIMRRLYAQMTPEACPALPSVVAHLSLPPSLLGSLLCAAATLACALRARPDAGTGSRR